MSEPFFFAPLPRRHYRVVLIDPPWKWSGGTKGRPQHYRRMTFNEVKGLPVRDLLHPEGARVFMWITGPLLIRMSELKVAWRLRYSTSISWIKLWPRDADNMFFFKNSLARGHGLEAVGNPEHVAIFKIGKPQSIKGNPFPNPMFAGRREHSRKPTDLHEEIDKRLAGPRCEIFARAPRDGWEVWGNETEKFAAPVLEAAE